MMLQIGRKRQQNKLRCQWRPLSLTAFTPSEISKTLTGRAKSLTGFTLIELVIVATIILILVAVSTPRFRSTFSDLELRDTSYNIGKIIKYAQQRAILEERRYRAVFDFENRSYRLLVESGEGKSSAEPASYAEGASAPGGDWERVTGRFGENFYLPEGVRFKGDKDKMTFLPNGRCDKSSIYVINKRNKVIEIRTTGRAGYVEISTIKKEE